MASRSPTSFRIRRRAGSISRRWSDCKKERGINKIVTHVSRDFDNPLPEDFLLRPLPK